MSEQSEFASVSRTGGGRGIAVPGFSVNNWKTKNILLIFVLIVLVAGCSDKNEKEMFLTTCKHIFADMGDVGVNGNRLCRCVIRELEEEYN